VYARESLLHGLSYTIYNFGLMQENDLCFGRVNIDVHMPKRNSDVEERPKGRCLCVQCCVHRLYTALDRPAIYRSRVDEEDESGFLACCIARGEETLYRKGWFRRIVVEGDLVRFLPLLLCGNLHEIVRDGAAVNGAYAVHTRETGEGKDVCFDLFIPLQRKSNPWTGHTSYIDGLYALTSM
jgi:hypothetical protein